jgi:hypothetical protein
MEAHVANTNVSKSAYCLFLRLETHRAHFRWRQSLVALLDDDGGPLLMFPLAAMLMRQTEEDAGLCAMPMAAAPHQNGLSCVRQPANHYSTYAAPRLDGCCLLDMQVKCKRVPINEQSNYAHTRVQSLSLLHAVTIKLPSYLVRY